MIKEVDDSTVFRFFRRRLNIIDAVRLDSVQYILFEADADNVNMFI